MINGFISPQRRKVTRLPLNALIASKTYRPLQLISRELPVKLALLKNLSGGSYFHGLAGKHAFLLTQTEFNNGNPVIFNKACTVNSIEKITGIDCQLVVKL